MTEARPPHARVARPALISAAIAAIVTLAVMLLTPSAAVPVGVGYDDAIYIDLARSLASGDGYRHGYLPGTPAGVHYPPLYPIWLSLWMSAGSAAWSDGGWVALGNVLFASLAAGVWTLWGVRALGLPAWVAASLSATSVLILPARMLSSLAFSEPFSWLVFGCAALATAIAAPWWARAVLVGLLPLVRTILIPFPLAHALSDARDRGAPAARRAASIVLALVPTSLWMLWSGARADELPAAWAGSYGTYAQMYAGSRFDLADVFSIAALQLRALSSMAAAMFTIPGAVIVLVCLTVGVVRMRRGHAWLAWGTVGYIALVLIWPFTPERFIWGLLPFLALVFAYGARLLLARAWAAPALRVAVIALLLVPCLAYGRATVSAYASRAWHAPLRVVAARNEPLVRWGRSLATRAPVATETDGLFSLATGLPSFPVVSPDPADKLGRGSALSARVEGSLCAVGAGWVALTSLDSDVAEAVRVLVRDSTARVRFEPPTPVGGGAVVARFTCAR